MANTTGLLTGRTALVTGASRGMGAGIARRLGAAGAAVAVNYRSDAESARAVVADVDAVGARAIAVPGDATDPGDLDAAVATTGEQLGDLDVLVVNSIGATDGVADRLRARTPVLDNIENITERATVQLRATLYACRAVVPVMRRRGGGTIVLVGASSTRRTTGAAGAEILVAKAAQDALARSLAVELGPENIRVHVVGPGFVPTSANESPDRPEMAESIAAQTPLRRVTTTDDVGDAVVLLASDLHRAATGTFLAVDGGQTMP